jgi:hypothetical protein
MRDGATPSSRSTGVLDVHLAENVLDDRRQQLAPIADMRGAQERRVPGFPVGFIRAGQSRLCGLLRQPPAAG